MITWTINGKPFADLDLANVTRKLTNMTVDRVSFEAVGRAVDQGLLFAYRDPVAIQRNGVPFFSGRAGRAPLNGSAKAESHSYEVLGSFDELDRLQYQQRWRVYSWVDNKAVPDWDYRTRVILGQAEDGTSQTIGAVMREVLQFAKSCGVNIAPGQIDAGPNFLWDEVLDLTCGDIIRRVARWAPDALGWVDYSTAVPTFNWVRRSNAPVALVDAKDCDPISLTELGRSEVPEVVLRYEVSSSSDGGSLEKTVIDAWPHGSTGRKVGAINQTIRLSGGRVMLQQQDLIVHGLPTPEPGDILRMWFQGKSTAVTDGNGGWKKGISNVNILSASRKLDAVMQKALVGELIEGTIQEWMLFGQPGSVYNLQAEEDIYTVNVSYDVVDDAGTTLRRVLFQRIDIVITATNGNTKTYVRPTVTMPDEIPQDLAHALWECCNARIYSGSVRLQEEEVTGSVHPGCLLHVENGSAAWLTMLAPIQSVTESLDVGATTITVGPPTHMTPQDVIDLLRANRTRGAPLSAALRLSGKSSDSGAILLGSKLPQKDASASPERFGDTAATVRSLRVHDGVLQQQYGPMVVCKDNGYGEWENLDLTPAIAGVWVTNIIGVKFDTTSGCFMIQTQDQRVLEVRSPSGWTEMDGGCAEDCDGSTGG